jgi:hypothetical protein
MNEERKPDRDAEGIPLGIGHVEILEPPSVFRHRAIPVVAAIAKQDSASSADTKHAMLGRFDQVRMIRGDRS